MLKKDFILQTMNYTDHYLNTKIKKVTSLMKDELGGKVMKEFVELRGEHMAILKTTTSQLYHDLQYS